MISVYQLNDSLIVGTLINNPITFNNSFGQSVDSVIGNIVITNIFSKSKKIIPLTGNIDSLENLISLGSFISDNDFYFTTRKIPRSDFIFWSSGNAFPPNSKKKIYKVINDSIEHVTDLISSQSVRDINAFSFVNVEGNYINSLGMDVNNISAIKIAEYDTNGVEIAISDTISGQFLIGMIQNPIDSTYQLFFHNSTVLKLNNNLQIIESIHPFLEKILLDGLNYLTLNLK